jgi:hypothetical protein
MSPEGGSESAEVNAHHRLFQFMLTPVNLIIFLLQLSAYFLLDVVWNHFILIMSHVP